MVVVDGVMEFGVLDVAAAAVVEPIAFFLLTIILISVMP